VIYSEKYALRKHTLGVGNRQFTGKLHRTSVDREVCPARGYLRREKQSIRACHNYLIGHFPRHELNVAIKPLTTPIDREILPQPRPGREVVAPAQIRNAKPIYQESTDVE
jgi:hypothetical protein